VGQSTSSESGTVRWTPGAALLADGLPRAGDLQSTARAEYHRFSDSVVLVRKLDTVTTAGILDRDRRMGGGVRLMAKSAMRLGGTRTARSVRTLAGTLRRAFDHSLR
jgi:hypothetical protein